MKGFFKRAYMVGPGGMTCPCIEYAPIIAKSSSAPMERAYETGSGHRKLQGVRRNGATLGVTARGFGLKMHEQAAGGWGVTCDLLLRM